MNERECEFVTSIIKIVFTVLPGGMAGGKIFNLELNAIHNIGGLIMLAVLFIFGYIIQGKENELRRHASNDRSVRNLPRVAGLHDELVPESA